jgi:PAS domain-containing protein
VVPSAAQTALAEAKTRTELALRGADLGTRDWDVPSGRVVFDERWTQMLGYEPDELAPSITTWETVVHPEDMPGVQQALQAHLRGDTAQYSTEHRLRHKSGHWVWVLDRDAEGAALRMCGSATATCATSSCA